MKDEIIRQPKVNILMATYNGKRYIKAQLDSLISQTYENIDIYIRDDGSTDGTVDFIKSYIQNNTSSKKIILLDDEHKNLRCPQSFYEIARKCERAEYYSFCDQDDVWYLDKVSRAVDRLEKEKNDEIVVYYSACDYKTEDGEFIRKSPPQRESLEVRDVLYYTPGSGFTIVFNEVARQRLILEVQTGRELHDRWILRGAACFGKAIYDSNSTAAHIRHTEAVTAGDSDNRSIFKQFVEAELKGDEAIRDKENIQFFYEQFHEILSEEQRKILAFFTDDGGSVGCRLKKTFYAKRLRRRLAGEIALRFLFLIGKV